MTSIERRASQRNLLLHAAPDQGRSASSEHSVARFPRSTSSQAPAQRASEAGRKYSVTRQLTRMLPHRESAHTDTGLECMPHVQDRILEDDLDKFLGDHWKRRHVVLTKDGLYFGRAEDTSSDAPVLDKVALRNVARIDNRNFEISKHLQKQSHLDPDRLDLFGGMHAAAGGLEKTGALAGGDNQGNVIALTTLETSDHCSRKYLLRCDSAATREEWKRALERHVEIQTKRAAQGDWVRHYQELSRAVFTNVWLRWFFALCILASFIIDALETQYLPLGRTDDALGVSFFYLELAFTILFTVELAWNMFSYWFWDFFGDSWSLFDFAVVITSIASVGTSANVKSIRMVRVLRALRVVSQFKSLRKIVRALTQAVQPVASAMFVAVIAISVFAILGVNFFAERAPEIFGDFGRAMWTLVTTATMENWTEYADELMGGVRGQLDPAVIAYFVVYVVLVSYVLTSIVIAVLLENFSDASRAEEELEMWEAEQRRNAEVSQQIRVLR